MAAEWFSQDDAPLGDVAVSTRVRLSRNLTGFLFPVKMSKDDRERVASIIKDALQSKSDYNEVRTENMTESALSFLEERGLRADESDLVSISPNGDVGILVNSGDHVRITSFTAGLDVEGAVKKAKEIDDLLQEKVQFAADKEIGYLTSALEDAGSGMKISVRLHIPSIVYCDRADIFVKNLQLEGFTVEAAYQDYNDDEVSSVEAIGAYYDVSIAHTKGDSETDIMAKITAQMRHSCDLERKFRHICTDDNRTLVTDLVIRDAAIVKVASFVDEREAEELISTIKWGVDLGILTNVDYKSFARLNYFVKDAHIDTSIRNSNFKFENDIKDDDEMKRNRIRAIMIGATLSCVKRSE